MTVVETRTRTLRCPADGTALCRLDRCRDECPRCGGIYRHGCLLLEGDR